MNAACKNRKCHTNGRLLMLHRANTSATVLHRLPSPAKRFAAAANRLRSFAGSILRGIAGMKDFQAHVQKMSVGPVVS